MLRRFDELQWLSGALHLSSSLLAAAGYCWQPPLLLSRWRSDNAWPAPIQVQLSVSDSLSSLVLPRPIRSMSLVSKRGTVSRDAFHKHFLHVFSSLIFVRVFVFVFLFSPNAAAAASAAVRRFLPCTSHFFVVLLQKKTHHYYPPPLYLYLFCRSSIAWPHLVSDSVHQFKFPPTR